MKVQAARRRKGRVRKGGFHYESAFVRNLGWVTVAEQAVLRTKRIAIGGLGGVGGSHLLTLTRLGVGGFNLADFDRFEALRNGEKIDLTAAEFKLLRAFLEHRGQVLTIDQILQVWGKDVFLTDRVVYTHVNNLRSKIEQDPHNPKLLISVRGIGYRFDG